MVAIITLSTMYMYYVHVPFFVSVALFVDESQVIFICLIITSDNMLFMYSTSFLWSSSHLYPHSFFCDTLVIS